MKALNCLAIVGVGLIGGSIGQAVRSRRLAARVVGCGSRPESLGVALRVGAVTDVAPDVQTAVANAELVVVAAPVNHIVEQVRQVARHCPPGTLITDAGSTKAQIVHQLDEAAQSDPDWGRDVHFVGSHPLAGNEKTGAQFADARLFVDRTVIVTPTPRTRTEDTEAICDFWRSLGAHALQMSAEDHDRALAATSHLPHLLSAAIAAATPEEYVTLTAGGWQDTTRIAGGDPVLWRQIMLSNRAHLLVALDRFSSRLADWRAALDSGDGPLLDQLLSEAKRIRDAVGS